MSTLFLQDTDATILLTDIREFSALVKKKGPAVELAITLSRFYEHVAAAAKAEGGRVIKLCGDGVLCAFVGVNDHRARGVRAVKRLVSSRDAFNEAGRLMQMPEIDYVTVCGTGRVLAGDLGAEKLRGFDVIGASVNRVFGLCQIATKRNVSHLVEASTIDALPAADRPTTMPADSVELDGETIRLYALAG